MFIPRKNQCDVCLGTKHGSVSTEDLEKHREAKSKAQECKKQDKIQSESDQNLSVWTVDLQAVLLSPKTQASCMFYKTKLHLHNFTAYSLDNKAGYCYCWDEVNGTLSGEVIASLQYQHFKMILEENKNISRLIIWSDGCGYQNRNATVSNAFLHLAK